MEKLKCRHCGQIMEAEDALTMAGVKVNQCLWCAVIKNDIMEQYWELDAEKLKQLHLIKEKMGL